MWKICDASCFFNALCSERWDQGKELFIEDPDIFEICLDFVQKTLRLTPENVCLRGRRLFAAFGISEQMFRMLTIVNNDSCEDVFANHFKDLQMSQAFCQNWKFQKNFHFDHQESNYWRMEGFVCWRQNLVAWSHGEEQEGGRKNFLPTLLKSVRESAVFGQ